MSKEKGNRTNIWDFLIESGDKVTVAFLVIVMNIILVVVAFRMHEHVTLILSMVNGFTLAIIGYFFGLNKGKKVGENDGPNGRS